MKNDIKKPKWNRFTVAKIGGAALLTIALASCDRAASCTNSDGVPKQSAQWIKSNIHTSARLDNVVDLGSVNGEEHNYSVSYKLSSDLHPYGDRFGEGIWTALISVKESCAETIIMNDFGSSGTISIHFEATQ